MNISFSKTTLNKIEDLFKEINYRIRYEKGNFSAGYCLVNDSKIIIINKFFDTKARIEALLEIIHQVSIPDQVLTEPSQQTLKKILTLDKTTKLVA